MSKRYDPFEWHQEEFDRVFKGKDKGGKGTVYDYTYKHCDHPPTPFLRGADKSWELSIGTKYTVSARAKSGEFGLIVNLTGNSIFHGRTHIIPPFFPELMKYSGKIVEEEGWQKEIVIDWPNYSVPLNLPFDFWVDLYEVMVTVPKSLMFCDGGHGRTGTGAAIMMIASGVMKDAEDAVKWVKGKYCKEAIEGKRQEEMVREFAKWMKGRR